MKKNPYNYDYKGNVILVYTEYAQEALEESAQKNLVLRSHGTGKANGGLLSVVIPLDNSIYLPITVVDDDNDSPNPLYPYQVHNELRGKSQINLELQNYTLAEVNAAKNLLSLGSFVEENGCIVLTDCGGGQVHIPDHKEHNMIDVLSSSSYYQNKFI